MGLRELMQECCQAVRELLPELPKPEQTALGRLVCGVVGSESAQLSQASAAIPGEEQDRSKQRRAQRLVANERLEVGRAQRRVLDRVLQGRQGRVDLLLDATTNGASAHQAGTVTLCLALRWHGRAVPLVWRTWVADEPGQHWDQAIPELCALVAEHLPETARVVLLADRGLGNAGLARVAQHLGWHYLFRVQRRTRVRLPDGAVREIGSLVEAPTPGESARARRARERRGCITSAAVGAARRERGATWASDRDAALPTNVVAIAGPTPDDPWLLLTDLPASPARCREYRHRTQEEELFRDLKSFGWQWHTSRLRRPDRVDRLLLVLVLATLWMDALAQHILRRGLRHLLEDRSRHCYSRFQLGLRWFRRCLTNGLHVPCSFSLPPDTRSLRKLS